MSRAVDILAKPPGCYPPGATLTTIYDVARHAEVSSATVSRVLNGSRTVDPKLASRVHDAVAKLGYRRNAVARSLRQQRTNLWAVIISDVTNPFFTSLVRGVEDAASEAGFSVVLCNSDESPEKELDYITVALSEQVAGVVISPTTDHVNLLVDAGCPVVTVDRDIPGVRADMVRADNERGAEMATKHLIDQGFQHIACITGLAQVSTAVQRLAGYRTALAKSGIPFDEDLVRYADFREEGAMVAMESLLDGSRKPDAVFVANNLMTLGVMGVLAERDLTMPDDMGLVGFDEIPWARSLLPEVTTVTQPTYHQGKYAAELLLQRIEDPERIPTRVVLETKLSVGETSTRD